MTKSKGAQLTSLNKVHPGEDTTFENQPYQILQGGRGKRKNLKEQCRLRGAGDNAGWGDRVQSSLRGKWGTMQAEQVDFALLNWAERHLRVKCLVASASLLKRVSSNVVLVHGISLCLLQREKEKGNKNRPYA